MERLKKLGTILVNKNVLYSLYDDLKQPQDKISELERKGLIIRVKRSLYAISPKIHNQKISRELVANHLYGPSYVSFESALSYYGLISEKVHTMRSVTAKWHKHYYTPLGHFEYVVMSAQYYPIGISREIIDNSNAFLIASPEKALCDKIVVTQNLQIRSVKEMQKYLEDDLRIDFSAVRNFDLDIIRQCAEVGRKKGELRLLLKIASKAPQVKNLRL
ncbi:hypothetical protein FACS189440_02300 [Bacteroidia bacterium]|nr:hypothetical protein FACS189423_02010 [Bacteroidia bacterium]GHT45730.1 hypothetical protein FACS189440_02300 [Bacteroidia bacterium]